LPVTDRPTGNRKSPTAVRSPQLVENRPVWVVVGFFSIELQVAYCVIAHITLNSFKKPISRPTCRSRENITFPKLVF